MSICWVSFYSVIMLSIIWLSAIMLSVIMLSVIILGFDEPSFVILSIEILSIIMLTSIKLSGILSCFIKLNVIKPSVIILNVMAPFNCCWQWQSQLAPLLSVLCPADATSLHQMSLPQMTVGQKYFNINFPLPSLTIVTIKCPGAIFTILQFLCSFYPLLNYAKNGSLKIGNKGPYLQHFIFCVTYELGQ
jgi:hypothetical protein